MLSQGDSLGYIILAVVAAVLLDALLVWSGRWPNPLVRIQGWVARTGLYQDEIAAPYLPGRKLAFAAGLVLLLAAHYAFTQPLPPLGLWETAWQISGALRLDVSYPENTLVGSLALLAGGVLLVWGHRRQPASTLFKSVRFHDRAPIPRLAAPAVALLLASIALLTIGAPALLVVLLWLVALGLLAVAAYQTDRSRGITLRPKLERNQLILLIGLVALAIVVGSVKLGAIPRSIIGDEGAFWESASAIARGEFRPNPFSFGVYSFPVASSIYQGAVIRLFGPSIWSWRFASVLVGALAVVPTYLLARSLFDRRVALFSSLAMIASPYLIAYERMGYNNTQSLLPVVAGLCLLVSGLKRGSWLYLLLAGYAFGLGFYTYTAGRLGVLVGLLYLMFLIGRQVLRGRKELHRSEVKLLLIAGVLAGVGVLAVSGPHLSYGTFVDPTSFRHKTLESLFPNVIYAGDVFPTRELFRDSPPVDLGGFELFVRADLYARLLLRGVLRSGLAFHQGDMISTHYIAGPLAGPSAAVFYAIGLVLMLAGIRRSRFALLGLWFLSGVFLLSAINTFPPRHQHMLPVIPALAILIGLGIRCSSDFLGSLFTRSRIAVVGIADLAALSIVVVGGLSNYFGTVQEQYLPSLEDELNFEALSFEFPRRLIHLYQGREPVEPWAIERVPNQARYQAVSVESLDSLNLQAKQRYSVFTQPGLAAEARDFLDRQPGIVYSLRSIEDAGGRELGAVFQLGAEVQPATMRPWLPSLPGEVGQVAASVLLASWLLAGFATLGRRAYRRMVERRLRGPPAFRPSADPKGPLAGAGQRFSPAARLRDWLDGLRLTDRAPARLTARAAALELVGLMVVVLLFSGKLLDFDPARLLPGNEYGAISYNDQVLLNSLLQDRAFPLWNPYIRAGVPYVADPFNHAFNPIATGPVLLFGVANGLKFAIVLSWGLAAVGQWTLARSLGIGRGARLWSAVVYALCGQAVARFFQGQYVFVFGYAWIPMVFAGVVLTLRHGRPRHFVLAAFSIAMVYFSGTTYYAFYLAVFLGLLAVAVALFRRPLQMEWLQVRRLLAVGALALGLTALQLIPSLEMRPYWVKPGDPELRLSQPPLDALTNLTSSSIERPVTLLTLPPEEFYGFIGVVPLAMALLAIPALLGSWRPRAILAFAGLLLLAFIWMTVRYTPLAHLVEASSLLNQFRYASRLSVFATLAVVNLAGLGLEWCLRRFGLDPEAPPRQKVTDKRRVAWYATTILLVFSAGQVFLTNRQLVSLRSRSVVPDQILEWIAEHDFGPTTVGIPISTGWHVAAGSYSIRYWDAWYHFDFYPPVDDQYSTRPFDIDPNLLVIGSEDSLYHTDAVPVRQFETIVVYRLEDSLPIAFYLADTTMQSPSEEQIRAQDVARLAFVQQGPNRFTVQADVEQEAGWIVVRSSYYPGWEAQIDDTPTRVESLNGWAAVRAQPGSHRYEFRYRPASFFIGLALSGVCLLVVAALLIGERGAGQVAALRARLLPRRQA